jgi:hypothetical protein
VLVNGPLVLLSPRRQWVPESAALSTNSLEKGFRHVEKTLALSDLALSLSVDAAVVNTLGGVDYEWLEITETLYMSRVQVDAKLLDVNSALYGYEYASCALVESLFFSYSPFDGLSGGIAVRM